jgi:hypothetical protein
MGRIEQRVEARREDPDYAEVRFDESDIAQRKHRKVVGGAWDRTGRLQIDFLREQGLNRSTGSSTSDAAGSGRAGTSWTTSSPATTSGSTSATT